jgi:perosamine synthetase
MAEGPEGVTELGFHYRMNDLAAALGLVQLKRQGELLGRLDGVLERYRAGLDDSRLVSPVPDRPYAGGTRAYAAFRVPGGRRDALRRHLAANGVQVNDNPYPSHLYGLYAPHRRSLPAAEAFCAEALHLPYYPDLKDEETDRIVELVRRFKG